MPRGDRTGPNGNGPKTGRSLGYCVGNETEAYLENRSQGFGGGYGHRRGLRQGFGRGYDQGRRNFTDTSEKTLVQNEINIIKDQLLNLEERLRNL